MISKLIFDLGFHKGEDTANYLSKGYNVIAVEANTELFEIGTRFFKSEIENGKLALLNKAIHGTSGAIVSFFINKNVTEWGSIKQEIAGQDKSKAVEQKIETITFADLCKEYGVPYYCKVDIERADLFVAYNLYRYQPPYISFELNKIDYFDIFCYLKQNGYTKFQLRNQANNNPYGSSGDFGVELPNYNWIDIHEALKRYIKFNELRQLDYSNLSFGWMDLHARL